MFLVGCLWACSEGGSPPAKERPTAGDDTATTLEDTVVHVPDPIPVDPTLDDTNLVVISEVGAVSGWGADGVERVRWEMKDLVDNPSCKSGRCRAEGVTPDGDGLLVNWALQNGLETYGGIVRLDPGGESLTPTWEMDEWAYPHEVVRDPGGPYLIVADAVMDAVVWVPDDGTGRAGKPIARIDESVAGLDSEHTPNGLQLVRDGATVYLLVSYRGNDPEQPGSEIGRIAFFDITDRAAPRLLWKFPPNGTLRAPHNPSLHWRDDRWILVYAHSHGYRAQAGTVGLAESTDLTRTPRYVADLVSPAIALYYPRGVEVLADDRFLLADSTSDADVGAVYLSRLPTMLEPEGRSGAYREDGTDQVFVELSEVQTFAAGFKETYRAFVWTPTW